MQLLLLIATEIEGHWWRNLLRLHLQGKVWMVTFTSYLKLGTWRCFPHIIVDFCHLPSPNLSSLYCYVSVKYLFVCLTVKEVNRALNLCILHVFVAWFLNVCLWGKEVNRAFNLCTIPLPLIVCTWFVVMSVAVHLWTCMSHHQSKVSITVRIL